VVTSLPDISGMQGLDLAGWRAWFIEAARLCLLATPDAGVTIFYQTDIKVDGTWMDKSYLCHRAAEEAGSSLLWHKIFARGGIDKPAFGRPGYTHLLCYSRGVRDQIKLSTPDVFSTQGEMTWSRAMGLNACELACRYVQTHTTTRRILDPFCGHGSVLAVANRRGLDALGVEIGRRRAQRARALKLGSE
jgi:hypothetical protein